MSGENTFTIGAREHTEGQAGSDDAVSFPYTATLVDGEQKQLGDITINGPTLSQFSMILSIIEDPTAQDVRALSSLYSFIKGLMSEEDARLVDYLIFRKHMTLTDVGSLMEGAIKFWSANPTVSLSDSSQSRMSPGTPSMPRPQPPESTTSAFGQTASSTSSTSGYEQQQPQAPILRPQPNQQWQG